MTKYLFVAIAVILTLSSCQKDNPTENNDEANAELDLIISNIYPDGKAAFILPQSDDYANIPQDPKNPITAEKVELGRMLYHDPSFGLNPTKVRGTATYSCASCHFAEGGFAARKAQGIGEGVAYV